MLGIKAAKSAFGWFRFMMRRNEISAQESTSADAHLCSQVNIICALASPLKSQAHICGDQYIRSIFWSVAGQG